MTAAGNHTSNSSTPMLIRTRSGSAFASALIRCSIRLSTPPRLVAGYTPMIRECSFLDQRHNTHNKMSNKMRQSCRVFLLRKLGPSLTSAQQNDLNRTQRGELTKIANVAFQPPSICFPTSQSAVFACKQEWKTFLTIPPGTPSHSCPRGVWDTRSSH